MQGTTYLQHLPIVLVRERECVNVLCDQKTFQVDSDVGDQLESLLRLPEVDEDSRRRHGELLAFLADEKLGSLCAQPAGSRFEVRDFRGDLPGAGAWLALRNLCLLLIACAALLVCVELPRFIPRALAVRDASLWSALLFLGPVLLHESVHKISATMFGIAGRPGVGLRGWLFLVATITFPTLYSLPRHLRWVPILAPLTLDSCICIALMSTARSDLAAFMCVTYAGMIVWQFLVFLRTDLYHFVATSFNQPNLNRLAWDAARSPTAMRTWPRPDRRAVVCYALLLLAASLLVARLVLALLATA
jgi:hypothetical protein